MAYRVGTSGFSFPDWVGEFYPPGVRREQMLQYYATEFDCVEINSTYYRIPPPRTFESMVARTPPGFDFVVKASNIVTHERRVDVGADEAYRAACAPLQDAGRYRGTLVQFPWALRNDPAAHAYLATLRSRLPAGPIFVEFRHASWAEPSTLDALRDLGLGFCVVDAPRLPSLMPTVLAATGDDAYVRFHGRNARHWWGGDSSLRYDYEYSRAQIEDWAGKLRTLSAGTTTTYVFFNNCHAGQAARNARLMKTLLSSPA